MVAKLQTALEVLKTLGGGMGKMEAKPEERKGKQ